MVQTIELYGKVIERLHAGECSEQLYEILRQEILRGRWGIGERMPSYKALAEQTGLNQWHIQRALARLDRDGYIERIRHKGMFVKATASTSNESLGKVLLVALQEDMIPDRFASQRLSVETQGFGLVDVNDILKVGGGLGLQMEFCPISREQSTLRHETGQDEGDNLFGVLSLLPADLLAPLLHPNHAVSTIFLGSDDPFSSPCLTGRPLVAAYRVTQALLQAGHRQIAVMPDPRLHPGSEQAAFDGIILAMRHAGLPLDSKQVPVLRHPVDPVPAGVTAVFCYSIELAQDCVEAFEGRGLRVPEELSVASLQTGMTHGNQGRTIVGAAYPWQTIIAKCFEMLLTPERQENRSISQLTFNPQVLGNQSVAPPRTSAEKI